MYEPQLNVTNLVAAIAGLMENVLHHEAPEPSTWASCDCTWAVQHGVEFRFPCSKHHTEDDGMTRCAICNDLHITQKARDVLSANFDDILRNGVGDGR